MHRYLGKRVLGLFYVHWLALNHATPKWRYSFLEYKSIVKIIVISFLKQWNIPFVDVLVVRSPLNNFRSSLFSEATYEERFTSYIIIICKLDAQTPPRTIKGKVNSKPIRNLARALKLLQTERVSPIRKTVYYLLFKTSKYQWPLLLLSYRWPLNPVWPKLKL